MNLPFFFLGKFFWISVALVGVMSLRLLLFLSLTSLFLNGNQTLLNVSSDDTRNDISLFFYFIGYRIHGSRTSSGLCYNYLVM